MALAYAKPKSAAERDAARANYYSDRPGDRQKAIRERKAFLRRKRMRNALAAAIYLLLIATALTACLRLNRTPSDPDAETEARRIQYTYDPSNGTQDRSPIWQIRE